MCDAALISVNMSIPTQPVLAKDLPSLGSYSKRSIIQNTQIRTHFIVAEERGANSGGAGITLQAAKYSSEDAAQIVEYIQLVVQFSKKYQPYKKTLQILEGLKIEKEDHDALLRAQKIQVSEESVSEVGGLTFSFSSECEPFWM